MDDFMTSITCEEYYMNDCEGDLRCEDKPNN